MRSARRATYRFATPGTAFCSWTTNGIATFLAPIAAGTLTYPPKTVSTPGARSRSVDATSAAARRTIAGIVRLSTVNDRFKPRTSSWTNSKPASGTMRLSSRLPPKNTMSRTSTPEETSDRATANAGWMCPPVPAAANANVMRKPNREPEYEICSRGSQRRRGSRSWRFPRTRRTAAGRR